MWFNYGRILAEYMYKIFQRKEKFSNLITIENQNILEKIKKNQNLLFLFQDILIILS